MHKYESNTKELTKELTVIIPTYNCKNYLKLAIDSLIENTTNPNLISVIIVVDGSTDGTWKMLEQFTDKPEKLLLKSLKVIGFTENIGECSAINIGVEEAKTKLIFTVNDDMVFMPGWDTYLLTNYENLKREYPDSITLSCKLIEPGLTEVTQLFFEKDFGTSFNNFNKKAFYEFTAKNIQEIFHEDCRCQPLLMEKSDFIRTGGWDIRFNKGPLSDPDFYIRLELNNIKSILTEQVLFYHFSGKATRLADESKDTTEEYKSDESDNSIKFADKWGFLPIGDPYRNFMILPPRHSKGITFPWVTKGLYESIINKIMENGGELNDK